MNKSQSIHEAELQKLKELATKLEPEPPALESYPDGQLRLAKEGNRKERRAYAALERRESRKAVRSFERGTGPWKRILAAQRASANNPPDPTLSPSESNPT